MLALVRAFLAGRIEECRLLAPQAVPAVSRDMLGAATNPIPLKTAMKLLGRGTGEMRLPMIPLDAVGEARVRKTLQEYGLL